MPFVIEAGVTPGTYIATLEKVTEEAGKFGTMRKWHWLLDIDGVLTPFVQFTTANTSPGSDSYKQLVALLGRELQTGEKIDDPTGQRATIVIEPNAKGYPKVTSVAAFVEPQQTLPGTPR